MANEESTKSSTRVLRLDGNPEGHSSTVNILLLPIDKVHWNIKSIIYILLKSAPEKIERNRNTIVNNQQNCQQNT